MNHVLGGQIITPVRSRGMESKDDMIPKAKTCWSGIRRFLANCPLRSYFVILASPVGQHTKGRTPGALSTSGNWRHSSTSSGPAALWIAAAVHGHMDPKVHYKPCANQRPVRLGTHACESAPANSPPSTPPPPSIRSLAALTIASSGTLVRSPR